MKNSTARILFLLVFALGKISFGNAQIVGPVKACEGDTLQYFVSNGNVPSANWVLPSNFTLISNQGLDTIKVRVNSGTGLLSYHSNTAMVFQTSVTVNPKPNVNASIQPANGACSGTPIQLNGTGASSYTWSEGITDGTPFKPLYNKFDVATFQPSGIFYGGGLVDLDRDGLEDVVASNRVYRNTGVLGQPVYQVFANPVFLSYSGTPYFSDLNNDGKPEIIYLQNSFPANIHVFWNKCDSGIINSNSFTEVIINASLGFRNFHIIDINNDGKKDFIGIGDPEAAQVNYIYNNTSINSITPASFSLSTFYPINIYDLFYSKPNQCVDFDNDGKDDFIWSYLNNVSINLNKGIIATNQLHSTFEKNLVIDNIWVYQNLSTLLVISDINADGLQDILYIENGTHNVVIAWNNSKPGKLIFEKQTIFTGIIPNNTLAVQDVDNDGKKDILFDYISGSSNKHSNLIIKNNYDINLPKNQWFKDTFSIYWGDLDAHLFFVDINLDGLKDALKFSSSWNGVRMAMPNKYVVSGTDTTGCSASKEIQVQPLMGNQVTLESYGRNLLCNSDSILLVARCRGIQNFSWYLNGLPAPQLNNDSLWVKGKGTYQAISTAPNGCTNASDKKVILKISNPIQSDLSSLESICLKTAPAPQFCASDTTVKIKFLWQEKKFTDTAWVNIGNSEQLILGPQQEEKWIRRIAIDDNCFTADTTNIKELKFYGEPIALFDVNQYFQCFSAHEFQFTSQIIDTSTRQKSFWFFSDGSTDTGDFIIKHFQNNIAHTVKLVVKTKDNCIDSMKTDIGFISNNLSVPICMLTIDTALNKNAVVFSRLKSPSITAYQIYKEGIVTGNYEPLAVQSASFPGYFVDTTSNPASRADRYKIATIDSCGNIGPLSDPHKTLHLSVSQGLNNSNTLIWQPYEGNIVLTTRIYRGPTPSSMSLLQEMQGTLFQFTDVNPLVGTNYYQVSLDFGKVCDTDVKLKRQFTQTLSNIGYDKLSSLADINAPQSCKIYPNPFTHELHIDVSAFLVGTNVKIFDVSGKLVFTHLITGQHETLNPELSAGFYWIELRSSDQSQHRQMIIKEE